MIFKEKERYQYELKVEKERRKTRAKPAPRAKAASSADSNNTDSPPADTQPQFARADTQVVQEAAQQIAAEVLDEPPSVGSRTPNYWSICFQGGTFERIQERASGDFSVTKQTKYIAQLPSLPERIVDERLPMLNPREVQVAREVGMTGRIWDGQSMVFDEAYQILMDLSILTDPGKGDLGKNKGQNPRAGWFNKYLQTGKSDHETKNNGAFGGLNVPMVG